MFKVNNFERGERLLKDARDYEKEAEEAFKRGQWNRTIRRAQEAVELYLKGTMKIMNIEVPKIHDVGRLFVKEIKEKGIPLDEEIADGIIWISSSLSERRAPAFYREEEYGEDEAKEALEGLRFISKVIEKVSEIMKNG